MNINQNFSLFPITTTVSGSGNISIAGFDLVDLVELYGSPLYLYDSATIKNQYNRLNSLFKKYYPGNASIAYAVKAYFSLKMAHYMAEMGLGADVVSLGEIRIAQMAGFKPEEIHLHGNNKSKEELEAALDWGIQAIVVDSLDELKFLEQIAEEKQKCARIWLRITPDLKVNTHPHIETSNTDSKFGMHIQNGQAKEGIRLAKASKWLQLVGLHTHLGSQLFDPEPYAQAIDMLMDLAHKEDYIPEEISPGGGWGVRYLDDDLSDDAEPWVRTVSEAVKDKCARFGWPLPKIVLEPGRWIVARSGVAVYTVGSQKTTVSGMPVVAVDGGMADNPRVALYQSWYTARLVENPLAPPEKDVRLVGKFCESGDVLITSVKLPPVHRGDLIVMPAAGAYQLSMSSNYNLADRPAVLLLEDGDIDVLQRREHPQDSPWWTME